MMNDEDGCGRRRVHSQQHCAVNEDEAGNGGRKERE
jgi:hypothetical protein